MFVILPFEKEFYALYNYPVDFVGHPLLDVIHDQMTVTPRSQFLSFNRLDERPIIALLPGSRKMEIKEMLHEMLAVRHHFQDHQFVIAAAPSVPEAFYLDVIRRSDVQLVSHQTYDLLRYSRAAMVASGTATLETALMGIPQVVCYKGNYLSYQIARRLVHVDYISLVNLVAAKPLIEELIQQDMNPVRLTAALKNIIQDDVVRQNMISGYTELKQKLGGGGASSRTAKLIVKYLLLPLFFFLSISTGFSQKTKQKELIESGIMKAKLSDFQAALMDFNQAILIDSAEAEPYYNRGIVRSEMQDYKGAILDFNKVIQIRPAYPEPYYNRGLAKDYLKDYLGSIQDYSRAIALKADFPDAFHNCALARFDLCDYNGAIDDFTRALQYKSDFPEAFYNRGLCRFNIHDFPGAIQDFNDAIRLDTTQYEYFSSRGATKAAAGNFDDAIADFQIALSINPEDSSTTRNLALAFLYVKNYQAALNLYSKILENEPEDAEVLANRGVAKNYLGDKAGACTDWKSASELGSEKAKSYLRKFCE
jgi:tetratricopeptide (TPR) repeat protein